MQPIDLIFCGLGALIVFGYALLLRILSILRTRHESVWVELGRPSFFKCLRSPHDLRRFLESTRLAELNDPKLFKLVLVRRWYGRIYLAVFIAAMFYILWGWRLLHPTRTP